MGLVAAIRRRAISLLSSENSRVRWGSRAIVATLFCTVLFGRESSPPALALWGAWNLLRFLWAAGWGAFHFRSIWPSFNVALKWASISAAAVGLLAFSRYYEEQVASGNPIVPAGVLVFSILLAIPFLAVFFTLLGLSFSALGVYRNRANPGSQKCGPLYVNAGWFATMIIAVGIPFVDGERSGPLQWLLTCLSRLALTSLPPLTLAFGRLLGWLNEGKDSPRDRLSRAFGKRLVLELVLRGRRHRVDLRGAALGSVGAVAALTIHHLGLIAPLENAALANGMRLRSEIAGPLRNDGTADEPLFVWVDLDEPHRRQAYLTGSESGIMADAIRIIASCKPRATLISAPTLSPQQDLPRALANREKLPPQEIERSRRDRHKFVAAVRESPTHLLLTEENTLEELAGQTVTPIALQGASRIAILPLKDIDRSAPVALLRLLRGTPQIWPLSDRQGRQLNTFTPNLLALHLTGNGNSNRIVHVSLTDLTTNADIRLTEERPTGTDSRQEVEFAPGRPPKPIPPRTRTVSSWMKAHDLLRNNIVILSGLDNAQTITMVGTIPIAEVQVRATQALLRGETVNGASGMLLTLFTLYIGAMAGHICARKSPLEAFWRNAIWLGVVSAVSAVLFALPGMRPNWFNPALPTLALLIAYVIVSQFSHLMERGERDRNRALLQRFVAPQVIEQYLDSPNELGLGGKKRQVCVLFADVRNFTGFAESHAPEEVIEVINEYTSALTTILYEYEGVLDKYTGDGLMALFLVGDDQPKDVRRAVEAAREMSLAAHRISARRVAEGKVPLNIGIGMHYGEAIVGLVGSAEISNYTAIGQTVVVSARLQSIATGGEVIISEEVHLQTVGSFNVEERDPVMVKGISAPIRPYLLLAGAVDASEGLVTRSEDPRP